MKDEILSLAKELIQIPYVSGSGEIEKAIQLFEVIKKYLSEYEFTAYALNGVPSLLFTNKPDEKKSFRIILNGHVDVVGARSHQYIPVEKEGRLYGRGAYDMKTALAVMIVLFQEVGKTVSYPLGFQVVADEETGGFEGTKHQLDQGVRAEFAISGEGTNFRIVHEAKTRLILRLTAVGKASHGAYPWLGDNAIWKLQQVIHIIMERFPLPTKESQDTTVNITYIGTQNSMYNKTPYHCEAVLDIRYTQTDKNILAYINSLLPEGVTSEIVHHFPSHYTDPNNPYIKLLQEQAKKIVGEELQLSRAHGTSDMPFFTEIGSNGVEFGLKGGGHHGLEEWVDTESIDDYYSVLKAFLENVGK